MNVDIIENYKNSTARLFLLDYDGTLANIAAKPWDAVPTPEILEILSTLAEDPKNTVVINSGRKHEELDEWLGHLPISFTAEHGMLLKLTGKTWEVTKALDNSWKPAVRALFDAYVARYEGSFIEEKTSGMVWHYRTVEDQEAGLAAAVHLQAELEPLAKQYGLRIMQGTKIVETQPEGVSKGIGAQYWLDSQGWDFILAAGDDTTDEDTFKAMPETAFTVKIGDGETTANTRLSSPADMLALLKKLSSAD
jgi:trehalose 6-phosphate synthase/phosphatase